MMKHSVSRYMWRWRFLDAESTRLDATLTNPVVIRKLLKHQFYPENSNPLIIRSRSIETVDPLSFSEANYFIQKLLIPTFTAANWRKEKITLYGINGEPMQEFGDATQTETVCDAILFKDRLKNQYVNCVIEILHEIEE
jgi:hypothetical protein